MAAVSSLTLSLWTGSFAGAAAPVGRARRAARLASPALGLGFGLR